MKPKIILWISATNLSKEEVNDLIDAGVVPMYHIGQNEPAMIDKFLGYNSPKEPIIWSTQLFNKTDTIKSITAPGKLEAMIEKARLPYTVPGLQCLDTEPLDKSPLEVYRKISMLPKSYIALYHAVRPYLNTFAYVMPFDPRSRMLYSVLGGLGIWQITQGTYPNTCTMDVVDSWYLLGKLSGDIYGVEVSAGGRGHKGTAQCFADAVARFPDERTLFVNPTSAGDPTPGNFEQIAKDIVEWIGK
jgi:hypothetical protein